MDADRITISSRAGKRRLAETIKPGKRELTTAGILQSLATTATAAAFFAVAAIAQQVLEHHGSSGRTGWLALLAASAIIRSAAGYAAARVAARGTSKVEADLRARLLKVLLSGDCPELSAGAQAAALIDEVERVGAYAERYVPASTAAGLVPVVLLIVVFPMNWFVGVLLLLCAPLPPLNLSIVGMGTADVANRYAEELRYLSGYFLDRLKGLATLRALGADEAELNRVRAASKRLTDSSMAVLRVAFVSAGVLEAIVTVSMAVVAIYIGLTLLGYVQITGLPRHMSLETGLFLLMVMPLYFQPVRVLAAAYHERAGALAAVEVLSPLLQDLVVDAQPRVGSLSRPPAVSVVNLTVRFPQRELPALTGLSFTIRPGELIGLTGASGAGKSTLLRAIAGQLAPSAGAVNLDGINCGALAPSAVAWLGQRPYLFAETLADNIALDRASVPQEEIARAATAAGLGSVLARLPEGLDTPVAELGWGLSGGEAHRIALARIFLRRASLVLLDEPTAHLDLDSEAAIIDVIVSLTSSATIVIASHSPAVLAACDRVIALDRGELVERDDRYLAAEAVI
jgi:ATP-binding cassette subfamily C protein CydD